jgi:hypothetical protein
MATRAQNERRFQHWMDLRQGGRRYWSDRPGRQTGFQRMVKIVDAAENTYNCFRKFMMMPVSLSKFIRNIHSTQAING